MGRSRPPRGSRSSGYHRRQEEARERRRQRLLVLGVGGVLVLVIGVLVAGVVLTSVLPPRATVLVVGDRTYTASELADRSITAARLGAQVTLAELVDRSVEALIREEILRQTGEPLVGMPTEEEIRQQVRERLGVGEAMEDGEFTTTYRQFLELVSVSQRDFEWIARSEVTADRLRERFADEIPEAGPQVRFYQLISRDREGLATLRERVLGGEDFVDTAVELGLASAEQLDQGWRLEEALPERQRMIVEALEPGEISEAIEPPGSFDVELYFVAERDAEREYDEGMRQRLQSVRLQEFLEQQRETLGVRVTLGDGERDWIVRQILSAR